MKGNAMDRFDEKCQGLNRLMDDLTKQDIMLAFSGGADSSVLLKAACEQAKKHDTNVYAVTIHTLLHPMKDLELAKRLAKDCGAVHKLLFIDELEEAGIADNPKNRCYLCKKYMFTRILEEAQKWNIEYVIEGTNADDTREYRPGIKALQELGILSPFLRNGFSKEEVRRLGRVYKMAVADKPSTPCLATRFPYQTRLSYENMRKVETIEDYIKQMGFYNVRARIHDNLVRIEVDEKDIPALMEKRRELVSMIKQMGYVYLTVDLEGFRSGSLDIMNCTDDM